MSKQEPYWFLFLVCFPANFNFGLNLSLAENSVMSRYSSPSFRLAQCLPIMLLVCATGAQATGKVYQYTQSNGVVAFSDRQPLNQSYRLLKFDCFACNPASSVNWSNTQLFLAEFQRSILLAAREHQLEPALIRAVIHAESGFKADAVSKRGARGLMQLMPATAKELGVKNSFDSHANILAGSAYFAKLLERYQGDIALASAAYNSGPGTVKKYAGIPPYAETKAYVKRVQILLQRYRSQLAATAQNTG
jgi:soluble lytic murein transglycosylase-like protein